MEAYQILEALWFCVGCKRQLVGVNLALELVFPTPADAGFFVGKFVGHSDRVFKPCPWIHLAALCAFAWLSTVFGDACGFFTQSCGDC